MFTEAVSNNDFIYHKSFQYTILPLVNMSFSLPSHVTLPTSAERHNLAIAEIAVFAVIWLVQFCTRSLQQWHYWSSKRKRRNVARCVFRGVVNLMGVVAESKLRHIRKLREHAF
jgi:hypothetical protein